MSMRVLIDAGADLILAPSGVKLSWRELELRAAFPSKL